MYAPFSPIFSGFQVFPFILPFSRFATWTGKKGRHTEVSLEGMEERFFEFERTGFIYHELSATVCFAAKREGAHRTG